jgi:hypothetical protein
MLLPVIVFMGCAAQADDDQEQQDILRAVQQASQQENQSVQPTVPTDVAQNQAQFDQLSRDVRTRNAIELCSCAGLTKWVHLYVESRDEGSSLTDERLYNSQFTTMPPTSIHILDGMLIRIYDSPSQTPDEIAIKFDIACEKEMPSDPNECPHSSHNRHNTQTIPQAEKALDSDMRH